MSITFFCDQIHDLSLNNNSNQKAPEFKIRYVKNEQYIDGQTMLIVDYDATNYSECYASSIEGADNCMKANTATWINVNCVCQSPIMEEVSAYFGLSQLVSTSLSDYNACTQFQTYPEYTYLSFFNLTFDLENLSLRKDRICSIIGKEILLTFQENSGALFEPIRERIKASTGVVRKMQIDYLQYLLFNAVVDNIYGQYEQIDGVISAIENTTEPDQNLFKLKKLLIEAQEIIIPLVKAFGNLHKGEQFIEERVMNYYEELYVKADRVKQKSKAQIELVNNIQLYRCSQKLA